MTLFFFQSGKQLPNLHYSYTLIICTVVKNVILFKYTKYIVEVMKTGHFRLMFTQKSSSILHQKGEGLINLVWSGGVPLFIPKLVSTLTDVDFVGCTSL